MTTVDASPVMALSITIPGKPASQGNPQAFTNGGKAYPKSTVNHRNMVIHELRAAWAGRERIEGAVKLHVRFMFARPASHYLPANSRRPHRVLKPDAPHHHLQKPDADKCVRLLMDAATIAGIWADDCRVIDLVAFKHWSQVDGTELHILVFA